MDGGAAEHWGTVLILRMHIFATCAMRCQGLQQKLVMRTEGAIWWERACLAAVRPEIQSPLPQKNKPMNQTTKHQELIVKRELNNMSRGLAESWILTNALMYVPNSE